MRRVPYPDGLLLLLLMLAPPSQAEIISSETLIYVGKETPEIKPSGVVKLSAKSADGVHITGISALAWDEDEGLLYAVTDKGLLHHLQPSFDKGKLTAVDLLATHKLGNNKGKRLKWNHRDSEGAFVINADNGIQGDSGLVVSFEKIPQIIRFTPQGKMIETYLLPPILANKNNYRTTNQMLEAVTLHPEKGMLTIAQRPMKGRKNQLLYALSGESWEYHMEKHKGNGVTAMETLPDGRILFMERAWHSFMSPLIVTLKEGRFTQEGKLELKIIATLSSSKGWVLDNFEGLTRHRGERFFMVSDDNNAFVQRTLLFYFEL
ncbi:MAG: esterase-like activity of phytase family protein [Pseudomonadota bacterium]|nr:esterase-like activity of phytase family protein [Pseudomonadota bacterium]